MVDGDSTRLQDSVWTLIPNSCESVSFPSPNVSKKHGSNNNEFVAENLLPSVFLHGKSGLFFFSGVLHPKKYTERNSSHFRWLENPSFSMVGCRNSSIRWTQVNQHMGFCVRIAIPKPYGFPSKMIPTVSISGIWVSFSEIPVDIPNATDFFTNSTLLELTYPLPKTLLKMIFFCPRFDILVPWRVSHQFMSIHVSGSTPVCSKPHLCGFDLLWNFAWQKGTEKWPFGCMQVIIFIHIYTYIYIYIHTYVCG